MRPTSGFLVESHAHRFCGGRILRRIGTDGESWALCSRCGAEDHTVRALCFCGQDGQIINGHSTGSACLHIGFVEGHEGHTQRNLWRFNDKGTRRQIAPIERTYWLALHGLGEFPNPVVGPGWDDVMGDDKPYRWPQAITKHDTPLGHLQARPILWRVEDHLCRGCGGRVLHSLWNVGMSPGGNPAYLCAECGWRETGMGPPMCYCEWTADHGDRHGMRSMVCMSVAKVRESPAMRVAVGYLGQNVDDKRTQVFVVPYNMLRVIETQLEAKEKPTP